MKLIRKMIVIALVLAISVSTLSGTRIRKAYAAEYTSASNMVFSGTWSEEKWITEASGDHWYKLVIPSDGNVEFKLMTYVRDANFGLYTEDFSQTLYEDIWIYGGSESQPKTEVYDFVLSAGTYYMKIWGDNGKYKINASYTDYGTNDGGAVSYDSSQPYSLGSQITGAITATDGEDWFRVIIPAVSYYTIYEQAYEEYSYISIFNEDLSKEVYSPYGYRNGDSSRPGTLNDNIILDPGVYYIKFSGDKGKYIFNLSPLNQTNCNHDYKTQYVDATYTSKGYQIHSCKLCGYSYKDNYTPKRVLGQVGTVYCSAGKGKANLSWYSIGDATGYQIRYSANRSMKKSVKMVRVKGKTNKVIKKLRHRKKYYIKVRAYKKEGKQTVYGKWSKKISIRIN